MYNDNLNVGVDLNHGAIRMLLIKIEGGRSAHSVMVRVKVLDLDSSTNDSPDMWPSAN